METEGPYIVAEKSGRYELLGPYRQTVTRSTYLSYDSAEQQAYLLNRAYAEGRKSAEKEIAQMKANVEVLKRDFGFVIEEREKDFKELLELANGIRDKPWLYNFKFNAWKKSRGLE